MLIELNEELPLPVEDIDPCFRTPNRRPRLCVAFGQAEGGAEGGTRCL